MQLRSKPQRQKNSMAIAQLITPEKHDLGGFSVYRSLPQPARAMVGPFIFFDHLGPAVFPPGKGVDVRPHPHINLATVTYLFEGSLLHRDSLGIVQEILPGEVNWMTAGKGVVHSERSPDHFRTSESTLHALQIWIALPENYEEINPTFSHHPATDLPQWTTTGTAATLIAGDFQQYTSPVQTFSPMLYLSLLFTENSQFQLPAISEKENIERAVYSVTPGISINGNPLEPHQLAVLAPNEAITLSGRADAKCAVIGGKPLGRRTKYWNFVSSEPARIEQAKKDWQTFTTDPSLSQRFHPVNGETECIPLPKNAKAISSDTPVQPLS